MIDYEKRALQELRAWQKSMVARPSFTGNLTRGIQEKVNGLIPDKVHQAITEAIKNMVKAVFIGSEFTSSYPLTRASLAERERLAREKADFYKRAGAVSGAGTGAGGFLLGLADFPILLSLKMKFLFDIAGLYGFNVGDYRERLFILYVFQLAFSNAERRAEIYRLISDWEHHAAALPKDLNLFDWKTFQQQYRDYIDLAKMLQLVPGIGAVVGAYANYRLIDKLAKTAMNAYRMRVLPGTLKY